MQRMINRLYSHGRRSIFRTEPIKMASAAKGTTTFTAPPEYFNTVTGNLGRYIQPHSPLMNILSQPTLVFERQVEYLNLFLAFEQHNKYALYDAMGTQIGWMIERDFGIMKAILRQIYRTHRPFTVDVLDMNGNVAMTIKRGFSFINSHIKAILPISDTNVKELQENDPQIDIDETENGIILGESVQNWHLWRRQYNLFEPVEGGRMSQFGRIDSPLFAWDFPVYNQHNEVCASVTRNFKGIFREMLTDTGVYVLRMDPVSFQFEGGDAFGPVCNDHLNIMEKASILTNAVSIDFDYFSRHSNVGGGGLFLFGDGE